METENSKKQRHDGEKQVVVQVQVAPFVAKTYEMVSEQRTNGLIRWGRKNNSFLVLDPADFSLLLLPSYFKHNNFSSFVRQLNTYGFRKVEPDRWEFAHESFLRGQIHLLPLIARQKRQTGDNIDQKTYTTEEEFDNETLLLEVVKLRKEQKALEEELRGMSKRLQVTEDRPHQLISFLVKLAEDPQLLPHLILSKKEKQLDQEKKRRLLYDANANNSLIPQSFDIMSQPIQDDSLYTLVQSGLVSNKIIQSSNTSFVLPQYEDGSGSQVVLLPEFGGPETKSVAYPFSLLDQMFFSSS